MKNGKSDEAFGRTVQELLTNRRGLNGFRFGSVRIGGKVVGDGQPRYVIAEIGINHNGDLDLAKRLISVAVAGGATP